jgi:hypothetical protein
MYKAKVRIKKENQIIDEYWFSADNKQSLLLSATSWFQGYLRAIGDFSHVRLTVPCVMSIDGYMAWNETYKLELMNTEGKVVTNIESIIEP